MDIRLIPFNRNCFFDDNIDNMNNKNNSNKSLELILDNDRSSNCGCIRGADIDIDDFPNDDTEDRINANQDYPVNYYHQGFHSTPWNARAKSNSSHFPMLDILQNTPEVSSHRIPMDFSPYLLSASPPASGFELMGYANQHSHSHMGMHPSAFDSGSCPIHTFSSVYTSSDSNTNLNKRRNGPLKSIIIKTEVSSDSEGDSSCPESPHSPGRIQKKVSFADHKGLALAQVRLVKEGPDEPPQLNPEVLSSLTKGANADVTCKPPIKLCFPQPASDYLAFREKINKELVSLENVILRDYTVEGTIKVKNITFEKRVFVRLSLDEWETFEDVDATYVPGPGLSYSDPYDTFSFKMDISPSFEVSKKIQFAVCFEENGNQHWDSNGGQNYCIVSEHYDQCRMSAPPGPSFNPRWLPEKRSETWSEFSVWRDLDTSSPYY